MMTLIESSPIQIKIPGEPVAKARAKVCKGGAYTPKKSKAWADAAALVAKSAMRGKRRFTGAVSVNIVAIFSVPKSWPKWKQKAALSGDMAHTVKPDKDNIEKNVNDALNRIVWIDDSYIVSGKTEKEYGEYPGVIVCVYHHNKMIAQIKKQIV